MASRPVLLIVTHTHTVTQVTRRGAILFRWERTESVDKLKTITHHPQPHTEADNERSVYQVRALSPAKPIDYMLSLLHHGVHGQIPSSLIGRMTSLFTIAQALGGVIPVFPVSHVSVNLWRRKDVTWEQTWMTLHHLTREFHRGGVGHVLLADCAMTSAGVWRGVAGSWHW